MQLQESGTRNSEPVASNNNPFTSQPWWRGMGQDNISQDMLGHGIENISPRETINNDLGSKTSKSQLKSGMDGGNDANKDMHITVMSQAGGKYGEQQPLMHTVSRVHPPLDEYVTPPSQLDLLGHNIACAPSTHSDLYYGGALPTYGHQALVHSQCVGVHSARMALPLEMTEEPVYVNAKQYHGILRRRQLRAKAELEKKLIKVRKPYLHESRHLHAMRRARGCGGRFVNAKKLDTEGSKGTPTSGTSCNIAGSTGPPNSSSAETVRTNYFRGSDSSVVHHKVTETQLHEMQLQQRYPSAKGQTDSDSNGDGCYPQYQGFQLFKYRSLSDTKVEERDFYGKQSDGIVANRAPRNRALTIK